MASTEKEGDDIPNQKGGLALFDYGHNESLFSENVLQTLIDISSHS